ncbi:hypothetical protein IAE22_33650, partial [Bacillus sp. S34]|nr:hypothetical protein [Bacillus sp. S34]
AVAHAFHDFGSGVPVISVGTAGGLMHGVEIGEVGAGVNVARATTDKGFRVLRVHRTAVVPLRWGHEGDRPDAGDLRAVPGGPEQPELRHVAVARDGPDAGQR